MSGTLLERLQQKMDAELEQYRSGLLSQGAQAVMDNAYELVIKSELAVLLESAFLSKQQVRALLMFRKDTWVDMYSARKISVRKAPVGLQMMLLCVTMLGYMGRPGLVTKAIYRVRQ